ncbi:hypothetical protein [Bradyrhizobium sp. BWC-3-1]|uniref:hypothetical protein n=1 Tax=Bradyrhizobium sp. BWC-3-1 TaxID=3080012 RepID=UPI00293EC98E|nr:hypothetical protein [Bradyrhizobium sp. BWC-3-1]WOH56012.1 hypothetical protein RX329_27480 [Bradyrhizobium sp. BWC-3-1]
MRDDVLARKHAVRALRRRATVGSGQVEASEQRKRRYGATIKDAMTALWEASDRVCGRRLKLMIPTLLPALEQHGRLQLGRADHNRVLAISDAATIDRLLVDVKIAANGGRRRRAGFYSAIRREAPIRTFNDGNSPPPVSAGSTWSPMAARRWPARHPNADDGRRRHGLDGVPAVAEAGRFAGHRGD